MASPLEQAINRWDKNARRALAKEVRWTLEDAKAHHTKVTASWKNKPTYVTLIIKGRESIVGSLTIGRNPIPFKWVDRGTGLYGPKHRSYFIFPRFAPALRFRTGYLPRTKPVAKFDVGPGKAFGPWRTVKTFVIHPGIKPRQFSETYNEDVRPILVKRIREAIASS
jgi:hypothetical protein